MIILLFLMSMDAEIGKAIEIPAFMRRPEARWEDLTGDGILDIWVTDNKEHLWVLDGTTMDAEPVRVPYEPIGKPVKPILENDVWRASVWSEGMLLLYRDHWQIVADMSVMERIRPGMQPITGGAYDLIPTYRGYWLMEDGCLYRELEAPPSIQIKSRILEMNWPRPDWRDLDGDGDQDLVAAPVLFEQHGESRLWSAIQENGDWQEQSSALEIPVGMDVSEWRTGDMDGDGFDELVILTMPTKNMSLFDELSFMIYRGTGHGQWERAPMQILKSKQNLWQTGPIEINSRGILLYYYKGLIRSHFKMDLYAWNPAGFVEPKPETRKWTLADADRSVILIGPDWNKDGQSDMILSDERGLVVYYRNPKGAMPFEEKRMELLSRVNTSDGEIEISVGEPVVDAARVSRHRARGNRSVALVERNNIQEAWFFTELDTGHWSLKRIK